MEHNARTIALRWRVGLTAIRCDCTHEIRLAAQCKRWERRRGESSMAVAVFVKGVVVAVVVVAVVVISSPLRRTTSH